MDIRKAIYLEGETRIYYECKLCGFAKNIVDYDRKALKSLEKCKCIPKHYQQDLALDSPDLPFYHPIKDYVS